MKIAVVGGGPAGMMAAYAAARQGQVWLFEKNENRPGFKKYALSGFVNVILAGFIKRLLRAFLFGRQGCSVRGRSCANQVAKTEGFVYTGNKAVPGTIVYPPGNPFENLFIYNKKEVER